jgi:hypothetical protein
MLSVPANPMSFIRSIGRVQPGLTVVRKGQRVDADLRRAARHRRAGLIQRIVQLEAHVGGDKRAACQRHGRYDRRRPEKTISWSSDLLRSLRHPEREDFEPTPRSQIPPECTRNRSQVKGKLRFLRSP